MYIEQRYTSCLSEAAYYIESEGEAAVIDPLRDIKPYLELAEQRNARIKYVFETHFHADFVSGHLDLARKTGARIIFGPGAATSYEVYNAKDEEQFSLGKVKIRALHTPGHTPESVCYLLIDENERDHALFTGDTLFVGDVGRPDLLDGVMTKEELAGMLYHSLNNKIKPLHDDVIVYPAHGAGSACGKNIGKEAWSTVGMQKKTNYALQEMDKETFIRKVTDGMLPPPGYFFEDAKINKQGYAPLDQIVKENNKALAVDEFKHELTNGALILDTRSPDDFEKGFIEGSLNIGLDGQFAVWVGTLISIERPLLLIAEPGRENETILRLARIGYENVRGYLFGGIRSWHEDLNTIHSITAGQMIAKMAAGISVIDVRKPGEFSTSHVPQALSLSLAAMPENLQNLDKESPYLVHCAGGYRSMIAASIMKREGFKDPINIYGGFAAIKQLMVMDNG